MSHLVPHIIEFPKIGGSIQGYISVAEKANLPFEVNRIYWTYFTPENVERGGHAHYQLEQIVVAVAGIVTVDLQTVNGEKSVYILNNPQQGLYIPKLTWRTMRYTHSAVQMCIASLAYDESDYIRDYAKFLEECKLS